MRSSKLLEISLPLQRVTAVVIITVKFQTRHNSLQLQVMLITIFNKLQTTSYYSVLINSLVIS